MANEKIIIPQENIPKTEEVRYLNTEIPSYEEFMRNYKSDEWVNASYESEINSQERGYGPCGENGCNCSCNWNSGCECKFKYSVSYDSHGPDDFHFGKFEHSGEMSIKPFGGLSSEQNTSLSLLRRVDSDSDIRFLSGYAGGKTNNDSVKFSAGIDVARTENKYVQARVGVNVDTGGSISGDGIEGKFLGFGLSIGKKTGISTPLGEVKFDVEESCVVQ